MPARNSKTAATSAATNNGLLTVTAQQSRFHAETDESNSLKEQPMIIVKDLSISKGNRLLLSNANLQLHRGRHYVLQGRNGIGKSTLLRAIADGRISSIPRRVKSLLLGQSQNLIEEDITEVAIENLSVLDYVVQSDKERERLLRQRNILASALETSDDPMAPVKAHRQILLEKVETTVAEARQVALRRSGARGATARDALYKLEEQMAEAETRTRQDASPDEISTETNGCVEMLAEVQISLDLMNDATAESKARAVLLGLGFSQESLSQPLSHLSDGWRTRCSLACALCQSVDLLLLDEPTNFLDLPSIVWLERYLQSMDEKTTVLVVTHDRAFGDEIAHELLVIREQQLEGFRGNLSAYETNRLKQYRYWTRMQEAQNMQRKHMQATIEGNLQAARRAGDDRKLKQANSRKKKLDERMGIEVSAKGTRFRLNRDLAGYHLSNRGEIKVPEFDPPAQIVIPTQTTDLRFPGPLLSMEGVCFSYASGQSQVPIVKDVNLTIHLGDRIGIAGLNGSGKSTLVTLAMGGDAAKPMVPTSGSTSRHPRAKFALYSQQAVEELESLAFSRPELTALSHLMEDFSAEAAEKDIRALLSGIGLAGSVASHVPIKLLSGGQRVRLALAKILWSPPHVLVLDEITTHLDTDTIQALVSALRNYEGAIIVVTHDRFFMRTVVEGESSRAFAAAPRPGKDDADELDEQSEDEDGVTRNRAVFCLSKGRLTKLERGMEQYEENAARSATKLGKA